MEALWNHGAAMPNLSIKNVPEDVVARLRTRAKANHRSLQGELLFLACAAARSLDPVAVPDRRPEGKPGGGKSIEQIAAEHRVRRPRPIADSPSAAELIRRERDAR